MGGQNFDIRKHLLDYDDVMNQQREVIYRQRKEALNGGNLREILDEMLEDVVDDLLETYADGKLPPGEWKPERLGPSGSFKLFALKSNFIGDEGNPTPASMPCGRRFSGMSGTCSGKRKRISANRSLDDSMRILMLQSIDTHWKDHLLNMDHLREGIGLRGYGQKGTPSGNTSAEGFELFMAMVEADQGGRPVQTLPGSDPPGGKRSRRAEEAATGLRHEAGARFRGAAAGQAERGEVGRNDPCPCGSGKTVQKCCGG